MDELFITQIPISSAESLPVEWEVRRLCKDKICCEFSMLYRRHDGKASKNKKKDKLRYFYKLTAFSGREKYIDKHSKELYCAIVACTSDSDPATCGNRFLPSDDVAASITFSKIKINMIVEMEATQNDYLVMPSNVDFSILPLNPSRFSFERSAVYGDVG
jgi:hypothetical protein